MSQLSIDNDVIAQCLSPAPSQTGGRVKRLRPNKNQTEYLTPRAAELYAVEAYKAGLINFYNMTRLSWLLKKRLPNNERRAKTLEMEIAELAPKV